MSTWRKLRFVSGKTYRVIVPISNGISHFSEGELVEFVEATYSAYDSSTALIFRSRKDGETKTLLLHDDDPDETTTFLVESA